jgi:CubicO group peptidase (beta-lactamase class C family)
MHIKTVRKYSFTGMITRLLIITVVILNSCKADNSLDKEMISLMNVLEIEQEIDTDSLLMRVQEHFNLPGIAFGIAQADSTFDIALRGYSNTELNEALCADDCFDLNSVTKSTTALLIANLVQEAKLSYNSTMVSLFPEIKDKIHSDFKTH